jgi:hypothetical protein
MFAPVMPIFHLLAEDVGDFFLGHVNGRHHHVRRGLSRQLNDPLAQVGLADFDAGFFEEGVEMDFFRGHRLRLDDALHAVLLREVENVLPDLGGIVGAKDLSATRFGLLGESLGQFVQMGSGVALALGDLGTNGLEVNALVRLLAADAIGLREASQRAGKIGIVDGGVDRLAEFLAHQFTFAVSSTKTMTSFSGP